MWKTCPAEDSNASKFGALLGLLAEASDSIGTSTLERVADHAWRSKDCRVRRSGLMHREPAGTWGNVFELVHGLDTAAPRKKNPLLPVGYITLPVLESNISFGVNDLSWDCRGSWLDKFPRVNIVVREDCVKFTIQEFTIHEDCLFRPLVLFPDGSAVADPVTLDAFRAVLDGLNGGVDDLRHALIAAFRTPRTLRTLSPVAAAAAAVPAAGTVPESVIRASPVLRDMAQDFDPARLRESIDGDDALLADMDAWLRLKDLPRPGISPYYDEDFRFMPARAAEVANLAHFLGIDCIADWIAETVGVLMSR